MNVVSIFIAVLVNFQVDTNWQVDRYLAWDTEHAEIIVARTGDIHRELDVAVLRESLRRKTGRSIHVIRQELMIDNQGSMQIIKFCMDQDSALLLKIEELLADWRKTQFDIQHFTRGAEDVTKKLHQSSFDSSDARELVMRFGTESSLEDLDSQVRTTLYRKFRRLPSLQMVDLPNSGRLLLDELQGVNSVIARYSELQETTEHAAILARLVELRREILRLDGASGTSNLRILK